MNHIIKQIKERIDVSDKKPGFLEALFGRTLREALQGKPVVLFGAGSLGKELYATLKKFEISPVCFCDNDETKKGSSYCNLPVISFAELKGWSPEALIVIASHKNVFSMTTQLMQNGFNHDKIFCSASNPFTPYLFMYSMIGTQCLFDSYQKECKYKTVFDRLVEQGQSVQKAYELFADQHAKDLFVSKLALMASNRSFALFIEFIKNFSRPVIDYGLGNYEGTPEDYYYFNNDVLTLSPGEVYIDVGAYDGDTVHTFVEACKKNKVNYSKIYAFEPDPHCYKALLKNTKEYRDVVCLQAGVWSQTKVLKFSTSENGIHDQAGKIDCLGNIKIKVFSLDDYLHNKKVTFIKMDPGGNVIPEAIRGAANIIAQYRPKLAFGSYHAATSMFEIPLIVHDICPDYKLYLRHNTYHLCDTDLLATV